MPLAGRYLDSRDHLHRAALLANQFLDPPGPLNLVMVSDSDQRQSSPLRRFDKPRWTDPPVAEVGMHVQVSATARGSRFALAAGHTASLGYALVSSGGEGIRSGCLFSVRPRREMMGR